MKSLFDFFVKKAGFLPTFKDTPYEIEDEEMFPGLTVMSVTKFIDDLLEFYLALKNKKYKYDRKFYNPHHAQDMMRFFSDFGAKVTLALDKSRTFSLFSLEVKPEIAKNILFVIPGLILPLIDDFEDAIDRIWYYDQQSAYVKLDPQLSKLFFSYGFRDQKRWLLKTNLESSIDDEYYRWCMNKIQDWRSAFAVSKTQPYKSKLSRELSETDKEKCTRMNRQCNKDPFLGSDWCDAKMKWSVGPDSEGKCFDLTELLNIIEAQLSTLKNGNPYPRQPFDPWTTIPFTLDELAYFWVKAGEGKWDDDDEDEDKGEGTFNIRSRFPKTAKYIGAAVNDEIKAEGRWSAADMEDVIDVLYS